MAQGHLRSDDTPSGPVRDLVNALYDLYRHAGMPSMRTISDGVRQRSDLPDTVSHETVSLMLRGPRPGKRVPSWSKYESVVRYLASIAVHRPDPEATVEQFYALWLPAYEADQVAPVGTRNTTALPATPGPLTSEGHWKPLPDDEPIIASLAALNSNLPPRNTRFVGREAQLRAIHEVLRTGASILTLNGIGGVGKTQLATEYVHRFRNEYDLIWWIPAEHPSLLRTSLAALGAQLNLPQSGERPHPPMQVIEALNRSSLRWLLVFDNARPKHSSQLLRTSESGRVLLTSRDPDWALHGRIFEIGVFERAESVELFQRRAASINITDADRLAEKLGDLPLAIEQLATWHVASGIPVTSYLDRLEQHVFEILLDPRAQVAGYPVTLAGLLDFALTELTQAAPVAAQLLELFAWLGSEPLSLTLLRSGRHGNVSAPLRDALRQAPSLNRAIRDLRRHGLVNVVDADPPCIQMHRLFQRLLYDRLTEDQLNRGRTNVQAILAAANPGEPDDSRFWDHYAEVGPHLNRADLALAADFEVRRVVLDQVRYLYRIGQYEESMELGRRLVAAAESSELDRPETDHNFVVLAKHHLANTTRTLGYHEEARRLTLEALDYVQSHSAFGPDHEYHVYLTQNRAYDMRIAGEYAKALAIDEANLRRQLRTDPDDNETIRLIRNNIAVNLRLLGRFAEAYEIDQEIVRQWHEMRGATDLRTLFAHTNLARDLFGLGRYREALDTLNSILPSYRAAIGPHYDGVLLAVRTQVMTLRKNGDVAEAAELAKENSHDLSMWFGTSHDFTLAAALSQVNAQLAVGDLGNAMLQASDVLRGCESRFGQDHPMRLAMLVNSAAVLRALDDRHGAYRQDELATTQLRKLLGDNHPYTLCATHNLAIDLALLGQDGKTFDECKAVLARSRLVRGEQHPDTVAGAINLALARITLGDQLGGRAELTAAVTALENLLGSRHPHVTAARAGNRIECDIEPPPM